MKSNLTLFVLVIASLAFIAPAFPQQARPASEAAAHKLTVPTNGKLRVAFVISDGAVMIDFAGPWEVFQDVHDYSRGDSMDEQMPFELYTVSDSKAPIQASDGMKIVPDYTFDDAPKPQIVVVPAQSEGSPRMMEWIRKMSTEADVLMSVCNGSFQLARAGVLKGKKATSHHGSYARFQHEFPDITVVRGMRYVQSDPVIFTAGGLSSGIDLALHVVELYFGRQVAETTARNMEYEGKGWMGDGTASVDFAAPVRYPHASDGLTGGALGNWEGVLTTNMGALHLLLHIWKDDKGGLTGTVDSIDEGADGLKLSEVAYKEGDLHLEVPSVGGVFNGKISQNDSEISGTWNQHGVPWPMSLKRSHGN